MAAALDLPNLDVTESKIHELVRRIVQAVDPIAVIAFGSRARGTHRPESDLDIAVILEGDEDERVSLPGGISAGLFLGVDLLPISSKKFEKFRPWINTVHRQIDREGVRLYERGRQSADQNTFRRLC